MPPNKVSFYELSIPLNLRTPRSVCYVLLTALLVQRTQGQSVVPSKTLSYVASEMP